MITHIIKADCGCEFETSPMGQRFHWCPLHKSAPELYEVVSLIHKAGFYPTPELRIKIDKALAEVDN